MASVDIPEGWLMLLSQKDRKGACQKACAERRPAAAAAREGNACRRNAPTCPASIALASAMAVAKAMEAGAKVIGCSSTGNAASSLAGKRAVAGLKTYIFVPSRAPKGKVAQLITFGANVISVDGSYEDTFRISAEAIKKWGWYNRNAHQPLPF